MSYPFTAIVGQDDMKLALVLNLINPRLGGVLVRGEKGTAKSTAVRALADLAPSRQVVAGCRFNCDPSAAEQLCADCQVRESLEATLDNLRVVELPISATEDRVVGTLDIEAAIKTGNKRFEQGLLAEANRNILYVDEVNLLEDHIVDVLLDAAAMGVNTVEREGVSYSHPARFILVGTMNPEEGELRPQLIDRFGMAVDVSGESDLDARVQVIRRRLAYEDDPVAFVDEFAGQQDALRAGIVKAINLLPHVTCSDNLLNAAAQIGVELHLDGHRGDLAMIKTALTIAAFAGRSEAQPEDLATSARLVLPHRMQRTPFQSAELDFSVVEDQIAAWSH